MTDADPPKITNDITDEERIYIKTRSQRIPVIPIYNPYGMTDYGYFPDRPKPVEINSDENGVSLHSYVTEDQIDISEIENLNL